MLSPDYLARIAEGSEEIASQLHTYIIRQIIDRMMIRIGRGDDCLLTSSDRWRIQILQDEGYLLEDITAELSKVTNRQEKEIKFAMEEAGVKALEYDHKIYEAAGLSPTPLTQSPQLIRLMERNMDATMGEWKNYTRTTAEAAQRLFINECDSAYQLVSSGAVSYTQAVKEAVNNVVSGGVIVQYPSGHKDTIETATARAVRTGVAQATGDISIKRMEEMDWDIILVSAHIGARTGDGGQNPGNHLWWQGQFYSRTGKDKRFPPFSQTGYGTGEGLCGWNCRHSFGSGDGVNNPYKDIQTADNYKVEQLENRQRTLERRIRKTKREVMGMQEAVDKCKDESAKFEMQLELDRKSYLLQRQNKAYNEFCKENDLRTQQERLQIARWNREQAAKARGAARRYQNAKGKEE
ncbi:phage capsid protein [Enterocloster bolteae]|uniref:Phage capsid protein n=1 Tax=Enterocloster bolteae TaxID=208479 RepID=A0A414AG89_9FIRM|nr:phage capsid protein [Enterocloster bolteae]